MVELQGLYLLLIFGGVGLLAWLSYRDQRRRIDQLQRERDQLAGELRETLGALDAVTRQKVRDYRLRSRPLADPPAGVLPTITKMEAQEPELAHDPYLFPVGWETTRGNPGVVCLTLDDRSEYRSGNIAITGESGYGKGHLLFLICATLCLRATTHQVQIFAIDPKRDFSLWKGKAHNWREPVLGRDPAQIRAALEALRTERERREALRERHRVLEFAEIPAALRPPMLLVAIAELDVLQYGTDDLDRWLAAEMSAARSSGIRYLIDAQNNSGRETRWRTHIGTYLAGFQSSQDWVRPNIGMTPAEIRELGAIPQHELQGRGYFTVRNGRDVVSVRAPQVETALRHELLARLPDTPAPIGVLDHRPGADRPPVPQAGARPQVVVTPEERARIVAAARLHPRRVDVCAAAFDGATGGPAYQKTKRVLDEEGLLLPAGEVALQG